MMLAHIDSISIVTQCQHYTRRVAQLARAIRTSQANLLDSAAESRSRLENALCLFKRAHPMTFEIKAIVPIVDCDVIVIFTSEYDAIHIDPTARASKKNIECENTLVHLMLRTIQMTSGVPALLDQVGNIRDTILDDNIICKDDAVPVDSGLLKQIVQANEKMDDGALKQRRAGVSWIEDARSVNGLGSVQCATYFGPAKPRKLRIALQFVRSTKCRFHCPPIFVRHENANHVYNCALSMCRSASSRRNSYGGSGAIVAPTGNSPINSFPSRLRTIDMPTSVRAKCVALTLGPLFRRYSRGTRAIQA